jgi:hypothetical protein
VNAKKLTTNIGANVEWMNFMITRR